MAHGLHHVRRIVRGRAVDAEADGDARRLELLGRADAHAEGHVGGGAMADADARALPRRSISLGVEMDAVRDPGAGARAIRPPPGDRPSACRTSRRRRRPRRATGRDGCAAGNRSARRARPIPPSPASARRAASRAQARRESSRRAWDRDRARSTRSLSSRIVSESCTIESGCRPPSFSEIPIDPRVTVMRRPSFVASSTSMSIAFFEARRKEIVMIGRGRAAGQHQFDQRHPDRDARGPRASCGPRRAPS